MTKPIVLKPPKVAGPPQTATAPSPAVVVSASYPVIEWKGVLEESWIHPDITGLKLLTGFRGKGKTSYALKTDHPSNILMLDLEDKGLTLAGPLGVENYFQPMTDVVQAYGSKYDVQFVYDRILQIVDAMPAGRFTTLFLDNAEDLQKGAAQYIRNNAAIAQKYGVNPANAASGGFGGAWPGVKYLIKNLLHLANSKGIKVVVVSFQLKGSWENSKPLFNKFQMTNVSIWHERSILTLVMVEPMAIHFPIPRALVMKESLSTFKIITDPSTGRKRTIQQRRLPLALPRAEPQYVYDYLDNPTDFKNPVLGETVTALELAPFTTGFSSEQLVEFEKMVRLQKELVGNIEEEV